MRLSPLAMPILHLHMIVHRYSLCGHRLFSTFAQFECKFAAVGIADGVAVTMNFLHDFDSFITARMHFRGKSKAGIEIWFTILKLKNEKNYLEMPKSSTFAASATAYYSDGLHEARNHAFSLVCGRFLLFMQSGHFVIGRTFLGLASAADLGFHGIPVFFAHCL